MNLELRELNFEEVGSWPLPAKLIALGFVFLFVLALVYWVDSKGQLNTLSQAHHEATSLKQEFEVKHHMAVNLDSYKEQLDVVRKSFSKMLRQLPVNTAEVPGLLEDISKSGTSSGLEFKLFDPLPEHQMDFYAELPIQMVVTGNYHQLATFIDKVASLDRIVTLHDFHIRKASSEHGATPGTNNKPSIDTLSMDVTAKTYRYTEGGQA